MTRGQIILRGLAALTGLMAILVGIPALAFTLGATPESLIPPLHGDLLIALHWAWQDGSLLTWLFRVLLWAGWLILVAQIAREVFAHLRYGAAVLHQRLAATGPRAWIASLVSSVILMAGTTSNAAPATPTTIVATAQADPSPATPNGDGAQVTVAHGDSLWSLAETHLGDGNRYPEILELNRHDIQNPNQLRPGQQLRLPTDAVQLPARSPLAYQIDVQPGDSASTIAQREYGDPAHWHRIWEINHHRPQPDGRVWRNPQIILPGWKLWIEPAHNAPESAHTTPRPTDNTRTPAPPPSADNDHHASPSTVTLPSGAVVGIGLATAVTALLIIGRRRRRARRKLPGTLHGRSEPRSSSPTLRALEYAALQAPAAEERRWTWPPNNAQLTAHTTAGRPVSLDLAANAGIGLTGPGAPSAARAIIAGLLTTDSLHPGQVIIASELLADVIGISDSQGITITDTIDDALTTLETELARRSRLLAEFEPDLGDDTALWRAYQDSDPAEALPEILLYIAPSRRANLRLEVILTLGRTRGIHGLLHGPWPTRLEIDDSGTITGATGHDLLGARLETLGPLEAADILATVNAARAESPAEPDEELPPAPPPPSLPAAAPVRLAVFGPFRIYVNGKELDSGLRKLSRELMAYLATHPGGTTLDTLQDQILPNTPFDKAKSQIQTAVSALRAQLRSLTGDADAAFITYRVERYQLDPETVTTDLIELDHLIASDEPSTSLIELCRPGEPLADDLYSWAEPVRESIRQQALNALLHLSRNTEGHQAIDALDTAVHLDPYAEPVYQRLIQLHTDSGNPNAAFAVYRQLRAKLADIDSEPTAETDALLPIRRPRPHR
ncbi:LysM peptidoglycan-binding domain-containing protein [Pseudonocardiaceae bacterium YIM PH 21723]|nr:LysM peptidoglycan-binding domain-containing protein [Pseudonocardiaceae bacterium YIM PH 21723]